MNKKFILLAFAFVLTGALIGGIISKRNVKSASGDISKEQIDTDYRSFRRNRR